jgi:hypothetical protein
MPLRHHTNGSNTLYMSYMDMKWSEVDISLHHDISYGIIFTPQVSQNSQFWFLRTTWPVGWFNSLTAKSVPSGTKNSHPVGFYIRNSTKSTVNPNTTIPQIWPPWWCRSPLIRRGIYGPARSYTPTLFRRGRAGGWLKRIIKIVKLLELYNKN